MKPTRLISVSIFLAFSLQTAGCAHYNPMALVFLPRDILVRNAVHVQIEEYYSAERGKMLFDSDLGKHGIFTLAVRVENLSRETWFVDYEKVFLEDNEGNRYPLLAAEKIKEQRKQWELGHGLAPAVPSAALITLPVMIAGASSSLVLSSVFYVVFLPILIPLALILSGESFFNAKKVNQRIKVDLAEKTLPFRTELETHESIQGVVFFEVPEKRRSRLFQGIVEVESLNSESNLIFSKQFQF